MPIASSRNNCSRYSRTQRQTMETSSSSCTIHSLARSTSCASMWMRMQLIFVSRPTLRHPASYWLYHRSISISRSWAFRVYHEPSASCISAMNRFTIDKERRGIWRSCRQVRARMEISLSSLTLYKSSLSLMGTLRSSILGPKERNT